MAAASDQIIVEEDEFRNVSSFADDHPAAYKWAIAIGTFVVYFLLLLVALQTESGNEYIMVRPALGLTPPLVLFFGWPALLACRVGDIASHLVLGYDFAYCVPVVISNCIYDLIPYIIWYVVFRKSKQPYPRFDTALKLGLTCGLFALSALYDSGAASFLNTTQEIFPGSDAVLFSLYFSNDFIFSLLLGIPLIIGLNRSPLTPLPPRWIHVPYVQYRLPSLSQQLVLLMLLITVVGVIAIDIADYVPSLMALAGSDNMTAYIVLINELLSTTSIHLAIILALTVVALRFLEYRFSRPMESLATSTRSFVEKLASYRESKSLDELKATDIVTGDRPYERSMDELVRSARAMRTDLVNYIDELEQTTADAQRISTELAIASSIQLSAVPSDFTAYHQRYQLDIAAIMRPAREVGGDFYDVFDTSPGHVGFLIADVSGKGMSAALFMMRALAEIREQMRYRSDVGEALTLANRSLCEHNDALLFVTVFAAVLDVETGQLSYANAGHNPVWLRSKYSTGWLKAPPGVVMGVMDTVVYKTCTVGLNPGDGIFLYTDGVTEAINDRNELFGNDRLEQTLRRIRSQETAENPVTAQDLVNAAIGAVDEFAGDQPQFDDITMMCLVWDLPVSTLLLPPDDTKLPELFEFLQPFCTGSGRTSQMAFELQIVMEELFVNIAHYGFPDGQIQQPVSIQIAVDEAHQKLCITLSDAGIAYDPLSYQSQKVEPGIEHRIGGLGILLVREMTDSIYYERANDLNIVHIVKSFK